MTAAASGARETDRRPLPHKPGSVLACLARMFSNACPASVLPHVLQVRRAVRQ